MLINSATHLLMSTHSCLLPASFLLFQKIDEENEANLLAVLTETLDSLPVDEDGLPSFDALTDGDVTTDNEASPSSMPDGTPPPQEAEEPSLVRTLPTVRLPRSASGYPLHGHDVEGLEFRLMPKQS